jgi:hypothetical protein
VILGDFRSMVYQLISAVIKLFVRIVSGFKIKLKD